MEGGGGVGLTETWGHPSGTKRGDFWGAAEGRKKVGLGRVGLNQ